MSGWKEQWSGLYAADRDVADDAAPRFSLFVR